VLAVYSAINVALRNRAWDPYPFILLNLFLSMLAAIQAPVIMMSQNRQDVKDRLRSELDFQVNRRAKTEIQSLSHRLSLLMDKMEDVEDVLRRTASPATGVVPAVDENRALRDLASVDLIRCDFRQLTTRTWVPSTIFPSRIPYRSV
jgi:uncharacterized membrane protein